MNRLPNDYRHHQFFQAVRLLEFLHPTHRGIGEALSPREEKIRFSARKGVSFPASAISTVAERDGGLDMEVAFMGVVGPCGVLPDWYHELLLERVKAGDTAMADFFDLFHHRLLSLFFRAWKRSNLAAQKHQDHGDTLSVHLLSLLGLGMTGLTKVSGSTEDALLMFSGQVSRQAPAACTIEKVIQERFRVPVRVEQFLARLVELEASDRTMLGQANSRLGADTVCGGRIWDSQSTFRLCLGPMSYRDFTALLSGLKLRDLVSLIRFLVGVEYEFEVRLTLRKDEVPSCIVGATSADSPRLGCTTWIKAPDAILDADPSVTISASEVHNLMSRLQVEQPCL